MNKDELLKLDNQLCFSIYACSREITSMYRPLLDQLGLTYPQYLVMLILWEHEESTVKELGEKLYLDSGTLTPMLKRMEAAALIKRQRSLEDERKVVVTLTEKGRTLKIEAACVPEALLATSEIALEELVKMVAQFKQLLHKIHHSNEHR